MCTLVFAGPSDDPLVDAIAESVGRAGIPIVRVQLVPATDQDADHAARYQRALTNLRGPVVLGGFSVGARIAASLCPAVEPRGLLCCGYPFHTAGDATARHGLETLSRVTAPTLIVQGTRDNHGTEAEVRGYRLPRAVQVLWLRDGNHRFVPRSRSGAREEDHLGAAADAAIAFIQRL